MSAMSRRVEPMRADLQAVDFVAEHLHLLLICSQGHTMH